MISKIDISKYGLFDSYSWDKEVGRDETFHKLNIIYGRNYSGKTTLARIFKCMEDNLMHKNYLDCSFRMTLSNGKVIQPGNLHEFSNELRLRVYNTDFVRENLSWLHDDSGKIKPFTILGAKNIELDKQISSIEIQLGSVERGNGLLFEFDKNSKKVAETSQSLKQLKDDLEDKLRRRANDKIKINDNLFKATATKKAYSVSDIIKDIENLGNDFKSHLITDEQSDNYKKLLKEVPLGDITSVIESKPKFNDYYNSSEEILTRKITPSQPISDLINDNILQEWVRNGIDKHRNKKDKCGFCGSILPSDLWAKLDAHFSQESEGLRDDINSKIKTLQAAKKSLSEFITLKKDLFYASLHTQFDLLISNWKTQSEIYSQNIDLIIEELSKRESDIFNQRKIPEVVDISNNLFDILKGFNVLIDEHNQKTSSLSKDQNTARKKLRYCNISEYLIEIDFLKVLSITDALEDTFVQLRLALKPLSDEIYQIQEEKRSLEAAAKDESKGAELVNMHLSHFFGHNELKLVAQGESPNMLFKIQRDGNDANNLSEGECSLISFCYFIAKMQDELADDANNNKLIIYIDDPISSLDSNHIFFMFSLIENVIAGPKKYGQLFISTHNLDFLKYLKTLTYSKFTIGTKQKPDIKYFIIERKSKTSTSLKPAPKYLKEYITEFNYLFDQIKKCAEGSEEDIAENYQYSFGNNMRKFLEAYLFYKYPTQMLSVDQRMDKFFKDDPVTKTLVKRLTHEYSHIAGQFDRGMEPIDLSEISKVANAVLNKIKNVDSDQYDALVQSVA